MINPGAKAWQHQVSLSIPAFVGIKKLRYLYRYLPKPTNEQPSPPVSIIGRYRYAQEIAPYGSRHDLTVRHSNARANHQEIFGGLCGSRGHVVRSSQDIASFLGTLKSFCVLGLPISQKVIVLSRLQFSLFTEVLSTFLFSSFFFYYQQLAGTGRAQTALIETFLQGHVPRRHCSRLRICAQSHFLASFARPCKTQDRIELFGGNYSWRQP